MGVYPGSSKQKRNQCSWCGMEVVKVGEMKSEKRLFKGPINHCKILHFTLSKMKINEALWTKDLTCPDKLNSFFWLLHWEQIGVEQTQKIDTRQEASAKIHVQFSSVHFSRSVMSDSLQPHETQHTRPPCPSPIPRVQPNPCPLSWWCHPTSSSSVVSFSSCPQFIPASGSFQMRGLFTSGGQRIGVSASTSVLPMNTQDWSPLGWTGWISLQCKGLSRVFSNTTVQ